MNINRVTAAAEVILAAQKQGRHVAAGWAMALEAAGMLRLPAEKDTATAAATSTPLIVYRAGWQHQAIPLGWYTTAAAARAHCEDVVSQEHPADVALIFDWLGEDEDLLEPRELVASIDGTEKSTNYIVTALEVDTVYDPGGDL